MKNNLMALYEHYNGEKVFNFTLCIINEKSGYRKTMQLSEEQAEKVKKHFFKKYHAIPEIETIGKNLFWKKTNIWH